MTGEVISGTIKVCRRSSCPFVLRLFCSSLNRSMTTSVCEKVFTFAELKQDHLELFEKLNYCCGCPEYKYFGGYYDFNCTINAWRFSALLTDKQWKALANLCINFKADISEVIRGCSFETSRVTIADSGNESSYWVPTSLCGRVKNLYFLIDTDGRCNM